MKAKIFVIENEESIRFTLENVLVDEGHTVVCAGNYMEAQTRLAQTDFDLMIVDLLLDRGSGIGILRDLRQRNLNFPVIITTADPDAENVEEALRLGAFDYLQKPVRQDKLLYATKMAIRHKALSNEKDRCRSNLDVIFRSIKDAIVTIDRKMVVVEFNEAAVEICGFSHRSIGKRFNALHRRCHDHCLEVLNRTFRTRQSVQANRIKCRFGRRPPRIVNVSAYPLIGRQGRFSGVVMLIKDVTRPVELEGKIQERRRFQRLVGKSTEMQKVYELIDVLANVETTALITGESGTGKELVAEALHFRGRRRNKPLVKVNCSALPESLLENELFGHVKGAFTGAVENKVGRFQKADGGTIFLDEIGDLSPKIQLALLRVLQQKEFELVGDPTPVKVDVRVIAATNRHLFDMVKRGDFREDLYYRVKVVEVPLPPLRDRREDLPILVNHFLRMFNRRFDKQIEAVSSDVGRVFGNHPWPGNVRQLENSIEHAFVLCRENIISVNHLPPDLINGDGPDIIAGCRKAGDEPQKILCVLGRTAWNKAKAARLLGINRKTLYRKIAKYKLSEHPP